MKKTIKSLFAIAIAAFAFTACSDVPEPDGYSPNTGDKVFEFNPTGSGTKEDPYTSADAIAYAKSLNQQESTNSVYIKGKVVAITESFTTNYGNATFTISDDGTAAGEVFTAYRVLYLGNKRYTANDTQIQVGDDVIVYGKVVNFKGNTPETVQGTAYLYSLNGVTVDTGDEGDTAEPKGTGTVTDPFNVAAAIAKCEEVGTAGSTETYYVKGKVASVTEQFSTQHGNVTFTMVDEGYSAVFTAYRVLYLGNRRWTTGDSQVQVGDEVIVCGKVVNYYGNTPETVQGDSYLYSLNGVTEGGSGGGGSTGTPSGDGTQANPFNVAAIINYVSALPADVETEEEYYFKGKVSRVAQIDTSYGNANFYISDDGTQSNEFYCFRVLHLDGAKFTSTDQIHVGDDVVVKGRVVNYKGNTPETVGNAAQLVSIENNGGGSGGDTSGGDVSGNTITVTFSNLGLSNQEKPSTLPLSDGTTLTFDSGGNTNAPAYYNSGTNLRMYPKNTMTINAGSKIIASIEISCDTYSGTLCNASGDVTVNGNRMTIDGTSLKYTGPNASTATVANVSANTGAQSQIRMLTLKITYAN